MMSAPSRKVYHGFPDKDAAMSLFAMGHMIVPRQTNKNNPNLNLISPFSSSADLKESTLVEVQNDRSQISDCRGYSTRYRITNGRLPPKKRHNKLKETKRDPKVSFEEMKRLMRVYGPTKCLRNRTPKDSGKDAKVLSVKRKFYRWFPDFHERFDLQAPGDWYKPRIGHEEEMDYREELRKVDQTLLAAKRIAKKNIKGEPGPQS